MEFNETLQALRKGKGLTQEELAQVLYVSRTAVSRWESGRGYPNIESLKAMAAFFSVTVDELLSGEQVLSLAQEETRQKEAHFRDLVFGLLDCSAGMLCFLPLFGQKTEGAVQAVSLLSLTAVESYLKAAYFVVLAGIILAGVLSLALQNCRHTLWVRSKYRLSLLLNAAGVLLFIISLQPYAAAFLFLFLAIKALMLIKWQ